MFFSLFRKAISNFYTDKKYNKTSALVQMLFKKFCYVVFFNYLKISNPKLITLLVSKYSLKPCYLILLQKEIALLKTLFYFNLYRVTHIVENILFQKKMLKRSFIIERKNDIKFKLFCYHVHLNNTSL